MTDDVGHGQPRRLRGTANTSRVLPVVRVGRSVDEFYDRLKTTSDAGHKLPNWCVVTFLRAWRTLWTNFAGARRGKLYLEVRLCPCNGGY